MITELILADRVTRAQVLSARPHAPVAREPAARPGRVAPLRRAAAVALHRLATAVEPRRPAVEPCQPAVS